MWCGAMDLVPFHRRHRAAAAGDPAQQRLLVLHCFGTGGLQGEAGPVSGSYNQTRRNK